MIEKSTAGPNRVQYTGQRLPFKDFIELILLDQTMTSRCPLTHTQSHRVTNTVVAIPDQRWNNLHGKLSISMALYLNGSILLLSVILS